ncbi:hypothetical protein BOTBODRAFT_179696 [Botryobasidium botryosum FD-172 SS1]|uniref:Uncharacterized protein n=1 Tax=Botryobasidium botryosum (strain FD-172 SS1) TaxID=930990 RepID=A0A067MAI8_BOTB1|nr:hypothetical protein BOTBODRAFT_179696 [Botryobasidium botryosum FD-172 SS1]
MINNGTWHDGAQTATDTAVLSASLTFTGTGAYVFGILPPPGPASVPTNLSFTLDGVANGTYSSTSESTGGGWHYKVGFFGVQGLANQSHTITMISDRPSSVMLDFFVYTYLAPDGTAPSSTSSRPHPSGWPHGHPQPSPQNQSAGASAVLAAAVGGAVGGVVLLLALAALAFWCCRKRKQEPVQGSSSSHIADLPVHQSPANQIITPWIDLSTSHPTVPTPSFMPASHSQQCLENQPLVPFQQNMPYSSPTSPRHTSQWSEYNGHAASARSRPPGTSDSNTSSGAPPSSLLLSPSPGGMLSPGPTHSVGTHGHTPPPQYYNAGP